MTEPDPLAAAEAYLRDRAMTFPGATEDFPWGHRALKVKGKMFLVVARSDADAAPAARGTADADLAPLRVTFKLPDSNGYALMQPYAKPTDYGLGKSGWVTCSFRPDDEIPLDLLDEWLEESYRAVAPKRLVLALNARQAGTPEPAPPAPKSRKSKSRRS